MSVYLTGLATALPPHVLPQETVLDVTRRLLAPEFPGFERLVPAFLSAGIDQRYSVVPPEWFETPKSWPDRHAAYVQGAGSLFVQAARAALEDAGITAAEIDVVVTVSSTGIATPTLEARAAAQLGFRPDVMRVPVFGLGCAGGVSGLAVARDLAAARPGARVLLVTVETCSLSFRWDRLRKADIIATVLFGDGAAAAVLGSTPTRGRPALRLGRGHQHLWDDTLGIMGWSVETDGMGVIFDRSIPDFATERLAPAAQGALEALGLERAQLDRFVCHPGGARVVTALESALELAPGTLGAEREVLRDCGNMSAPTVLFVLRRVLDAGQAGTLLLAALGPGFTASFLPLLAEGA